MTEGLGDLSTELIIEDASGSWLEGWGRNLGRAQVVGGIDQWGGL